MEGGTGRKRPSRLRDDNNRQERPLRSTDVCNQGAVHKRGGGREDRSNSSEDEVEDEVELDSKVNRFFEIMRRVWDMNESRRRANQRLSNAPLPPPPPWIPKFRQEDFGPAGATRQGNPCTAVATGTAFNEGQETGNDDGKHNGGSAITARGSPQLGSVDVAGNDVAQGDKGASRGTVEPMTNSLTVEHERRGTGKLLNVLPPECSSLGEGLEQEGSGPSTGRTEGNCGAPSLELKLALW